MSKDFGELYQRACRAIEGLSPEGLRAALDAGLPVGFPGAFSLLELAVASDNEQAVVLLVSLGASFEQISAGSERYPIHACKSVGMLDLVVSLGADVNAQTPSGVSLLHVLAGLGACDVMRRALQHGATGHSRAFGCDALLTCVRLRQPAALQVLLEAGFSPQVYDDRGRCAIELAIERVKEMPHERSLGVVEVLLAHPEVDPFESFSGRSLLQMASSSSKRGAPYLEQVRGLVRLARQRVQSERTHEQIERNFSGQNSEDVRFKARTMSL